MTVGTVGHLCLSAFERFGPRVLVDHRSERGSRQWTYADVAVRLAQLIQDMERSGISRGDCVLSCVEGTVPSVFYTLAWACSGVRFLPASTALSMDALRQLQQRSGSTHVFSQGHHHEQLVQAGFSTTSIDPSMIERLHGRAPTLQAALRILGDAHADVNRSSIYALMATSGTTGRPKLVLKTHASVTAPCQWMPDYLGLTQCEPPERFMMVASLRHGFGHVTLVLALYLGACLCVPEHIEAQASLDIIRSLKPTIMLAHPRVLLTCRKQARDRGLCTWFAPGLRIVRMSGDRAQPALLRELANQSIDVGEIMGSSETGAIACTPLDDWRPEFAGKLSPLIDASIAQDGELLVSASYTIGRHVDDIEQMPESFLVHPFATGDVATISEDGHLRMLGRKFPILNTLDGNNLRPDLLEQRILAVLPGVDQVIVVGHGRATLSALLVQLSPGDTAVFDPVLLPRPEHPALYRAATRQLMAANQDLETTEQIKRFAYVRSGAPIPVATTSQRRRLREHCADLIETLYAQDESVGVIPC